MMLLFKYPYSPFHIREIARHTGLSSTGVIKIIKKLKKEQLLVSKKAKNVEEVKPCFDGKFLIMKRLYNIYSLYEFGLVEYLKKVYEMPKAIIVFGSYANGTDAEKSDIDIAIITKGKQIADTKKFNKKFARNINLHLINLDTASKEFKNSLANGVVLDGFVELI